VDGNFKLKGKQRNLKDVELMPGWGAYVPETKYKAHIANYVDEPEVSPKYLDENLPRSLNVHNRSTHVSPSTTLLFAWVLGTRLVMLSQGR
jgi:hypothetical protein